MGKFSKEKFCNLAPNDPRRKKRDIESFIVVPTQIAFLEDTYNNGGKSYHVNDYRTVS